MSIYRVAFLFGYDQGVDTEQWAIMSGGSKGMFCGNGVAPHTCRAIHVWEYDVIDEELFLDQSSESEAVEWYAKIGNWTSDRFWSIKHPHYVRPTCSGLPILPWQEYFETGEQAYLGEISLSPLWPGGAYVPLWSLEPIVNHVGLTVSQWKRWAVALDAYTTHKATRGF